VSERQYIRASQASKILNGTIFHAQQYVHNVSRILAVVKASVLLCVSVALSVCPWHSATVSKQCQLGSPNLHCRLPQIWLEFQDLKNGAR